MTKHRPPVWVLTLSPADRAAVRWLYQDLASRGYPAQVCAKAVSRYALTLHARNRKAG